TPHTLARTSRNQASANSSLAQQLGSSSDSRIVAARYLVAASMSSRTTPDSRASVGMPSQALTQAAMRRASRQHRSFSTNRHGLGVYRICSAIVTPHLPQSQRQAPTPPPQSIPSATWSASGAYPPVDARNWAGSMYRRLLCRYTWHQLPVDSPRPLRGAYR